jgi:pectinesterase
VHVRGDGYITAASTPPEQPHGFVFANGRITGEPGVHAYLGRPWRDFAAVAFVNTAMDGVVRPEGWHNWDRPEREKSVRYAEGGSTGEGAAAGRRVPWGRRLSRAEMSALSAARVLAGADRWNPQLGIP